MNKIFLNYLKEECICDKNFKRKEKLVVEK